MRTAAARGAQVFLLVGPLAGRIAASLLPQQSAVVSDEGTTTKILLEVVSSSGTQTQNLSPLSQQLGAGLGHQLGAQDDAPPLLNASAAAAPFQDHRQHLHPLQPELQLQRQQQQLATSGALMNSLVSSAAAAAADYDQEAAVSLAATLARLSGWQLLLVVALISLILISIVGNCLVCVAIFTDRRLRKLGNAFIVSLAIADLFVSCLVMTFALCNDLMDWWMFGERFCDIWISFDIMCCTASILNLCAISLDRFIHIKDCLLYNQMMTRRVALSAVLGIWLISGLVSFVPINLGWHKPDHFKSSAPPSAGAGRLMSAGHSAGAFANETHAILFAATASESDNLMHGQRMRRQATPFEPTEAAAAAAAVDGSATSENSGTQAAAPPPQHFHHNTQFARLATALELAGARPIRLANKDFVPTARRPAARAGNRQRQWSGRASSGSSGGQRHAAQVDFAGSHAPGSLANYYYSNQLASETAPPGPWPASQKQSDDQVEFNPQDGPASGGQIKPQLRKKRLAAQPGAGMPLVAQTDRSSGQRAGRSAALLDHAAERPSMDGTEEPAEASFRPQSGRPIRRRPLEKAPDGEGGQAAGRAHLPQCTMTLTPTYAIISSTISFYIPCLIMLGLYSKLFACARRHVRNIRAITRAPHPIAATAAALAPAGVTLQAATNSALAPSNGASAPAQSSSRPPETRTTTSSSCRSRFSEQQQQQPNEPAAAAASCSASTCQRRLPLASRARTWIKFAARRPPKGSQRECGTPESLRQTGSTPAQSIGAPARGDNSTSGASSSSTSASSSAPNDRRPAGQLMAQKLSTTSGANEKTIDQAPARGCPSDRAREDEPFLKGGPKLAEEEEHEKPASGRANEYCDNANDSPKRLNSNASSKFVAGAASVKLNLAPSEFQQQQAAAAASQLQQQLHKQQQTSQLATHKAAITLGIIMGTFLFCWVPFFCLNIIKAFYVDSIPGSMFRAFTWLGYANSALNPIIYGIHNSEFRNAFNRIFFKHLTLKNGRHYLNRRFSYDLRPHHQQARQQHAHQQSQQAQQQQQQLQRDHHHQHQSRHATNHNTSRPLSGGPVPASTNHQLGSPNKRHDLSGPDKRQTSRLDEVRALVDHDQRNAPTGFHHKGQQQLQEQSTMLAPQRSLATFHPASSEQT